MEMSADKEPHGSREHTESLQDWTVEETDEQVPLRKRTQPKELAWAQRHISELAPPEGLRQRAAGSLRTQKREEQGFFHEYTKVWGLMLTPRDWWRPEESSYFENHKETIGIYSLLANIILYKSSIKNIYILMNQPQFNHYQ